MVIVGLGIVFILLHERERVNEIDAETKEINQVREGIHAAHHIARHATLGKSVIGWKAAETPCTRIACCKR